MPLHAIDIASHRVRAAHLRTPPLVLLTDASRLEDVPAPVRQAADQIWLRPEASLELNEPPAGGFGCLLWRRHERLLQGTASQIRFAFSVAGRRYFVPVHYRCSEDLDLIGIEPRWFSPADPSRGAAVLEDSLDLRVRIAAAPGGEVMKPSSGGDEGGPTNGRHGGAAPESLRRAAAEPWQQLAVALRCECERPGEGIAALAQVAQAPGLHPLLHSLCLRNLVVALLRQKAWEQAKLLLAQARQLYPEYRELDFLGAKLALALGDAAAAVGDLKRATAPSAAASPANYVGSGGESSFRAHHLLALLAEQTGHQQVAFHHFLTGVRQTPAFAPSVAGLLRQRLSPGMFAAAEWELSRLGRREPWYQRPVFDFFLLHRAWAAAQNLVRIWPLAPAEQAALEARLERLAPLYRPSRRAVGVPAGIVLHGQFLLHASVARINRYLAAALLADPNFDVALEPAAAGLEPAAHFPGHQAWAAALARLPRRLDLTVRHGWPPDFTAPPTGKLALILPWEFGAIPQVWMRGLGRVDEIWVPSQFVRQVLLRAGVEAARVAVIPNGVDLDLYQPQGERARPERARSVSFLFVGGAIRRKGMDLLLRAWREAFSAGDDVSLVIKDLGSQSFYRHLSLRPAIEALASDPGAAPVLHLEEEWSEARLPALYRGCDVVVLPYRGEGFGMPLAEGLACGKPVIATAAGPAPEFCPPEASWMIPAEEVEMPRELWPPGEASGPMTWFEPALEALVGALRSAYREAADLPRRGALGAEAIRGTHGWEAVTRRYRERIVALLTRAD